MYPVSVVGERTLALLAALLLATGPATAQEAQPAPAAQAPKIHKMVIYDGPVRKVFYFTESDSPHFQALCRILQWAENEETLVDQLQQLKLESVSNERRLESFRTSQELGLAFRFVGRRGRFWPGGLIGESSLKSALADVMASEATPAAAVQLIRMLEQAQLDVAAELKKPVPKEGQESQGPSDALPKAVAAAFPPRDAVPPNRLGAPPMLLLPSGARLVVDSRKPSPLGIGAVPAPQWPNGGDPSDPDRQALERARQVLEQERAIFMKEQTACIPQLRGDPSEREAARKRLQAAGARWSEASKCWSEACRHWSEISAQRAAARRASLTGWMNPSSGERSETNGSASTAADRK